MNAALQKNAHHYIMFQVIHENYSDDDINNENSDDDNESSEITDDFLSLDTLYHTFSIIRNQ